MPYLGTVPRTSEGYIDSFIRSLGMAWLCALLSIILIGVVLLDAFEAMVLPRRVRHHYRLSRLFYRTSWSIWRKIAHRLRSDRRRRGFLSVFGPLSLFGLTAVWAVGLITGFAILHWSLQTALALPITTDHTLATYLYFSGTTFFTLGYGDLVPSEGFGRFLSVAEAGLGFGFLAVVISYLPVLYQAFSRREITISLLDARAGSPPSAGEFLRRMAQDRGLDRVGPLLVEWERWAAEVLESHLSYPVLRFYRSQHDNQSWLAALAVILDTTAVLIAMGEAPDSYQARLTFAMARHAAVDLVLVSQTPLQNPESDRLPAKDLTQLLGVLRGAGQSMRDDLSVGNSLSDLRRLYEPFVNALADYLQFTLPAFMPLNQPVDNWQSSPGMRRSPGLSSLQSSPGLDEHYD